MVPFSKRLGMKEASDTAEKSSKTKSRSLLDKKLLSSPTQIWKSKLSWRITFAVFLTILTVEAIILNFSLKDLEQQKLLELREIGRSAIAPMMEFSAGEFLASPVTDRDATRILSSTAVNGFAIYSLQYDFIASYGEPMALTILSEESLSRTFRSGDGAAYEVVYRGSELNGTYIVVARLDSSQVQEDVFAFVQQTILIIMLMSAFVTSVLMITLGYWLLEPILFLRENLMAASKNPEDPKIKDSPFDINDEIGGAIELAQNLIKENAKNLTQIKSAAEDKIHRLAYYDTLTNLPNRTLFLQNIAQMAQSKDESTVPRFAVVTMNLDHFKDVNDTMGHNVGDAILRGVGKRLRSAMPEAAVVARTGADEFAIAMPLTSDALKGKDIAERVMGVIRSEPFKVFNETFQIRASIGVSTFPDDAIDPDQVLKHADIALNRAKEEGRDTYKEYSEDFDKAVQYRFQMLRDLRDAMEHNQLQLHYQPQLDLKTGRVIGAEALLRWWKPDNSKNGGSFISPGEFIPVAESSGLIVPIGEWVLSEACKTLKELIDVHKFDIRIAVNVAAAQFTQSDLVGYTDKILREKGLEARRVELEVTESVFMDDIQHTIQTLQRLHSLGVELAIDDFGTGYSSLSYLRQFPIDRLKIDQSFIRNALNDQDDASIAKTIIALGRALNLNVIAEGVETLEHEEFLVREGCDEVQGFRYSKPLPKDQLIEFIAGYDGNLRSFDKDDG